MLAMISYVLIVSGLLSAAALVAEHAAKQRGTSRRWIWMLTIVASLLLPLIIPNVTFQVPNLIKASNTTKTIVLRDATSIPLPTAVLDLGVPDANARPHRLDALFHGIWLATSLVMLTGVVLSGCLLYWRKRLWDRGSLCGRSVLIAPDVGPAVVGLLRPRIVIPAWLLRESATRQQSVLAHEQSHLDARDPQMLTVALCLLIAMPWNLPLWWQFHRLRRAVEVDCDTRVLRGGQDVSEYCETLIQVGQIQSSYIGAVAAMSESGSFLEQRIKTMLVKPGKWARLSALAMICASLSVAVFAAQVTPPDDTDVAAQHEVSVAPSILASYVGVYKFGPYSVMTVKLDGSQLSTQLTGQVFVPVYASSNSEFFTKLVKAHMNFVVDAQGKTTALEFYQNGHHVTAPRIDAAMAQSIQSGLEARVHAQQPYPDSEQDLQILLSGNTDTPRLNPKLAKLMRDQKPAVDDFLGKLGPVTSHEFVGVTPQGWDKYLVRHANGTEEVGFALDSDNTIAGAFRRP
jgi:beta-lactamase regulating signal transducer with metallopeptidase domain